MQLQRVTWKKKKRVLYSSSSFRLLKMFYKKKKGLLCVTLGRPLFSVVSFPKGKDFFLIYYKKG